MRRFLRGREHGWASSGQARLSRSRLHVMAQPLPLPPPGFDELPVDEKIDYVQALWDRIAAEAEQLPLHEWQRQLLEERLAAHRASPDEARPWREVLDDLEGRLKRR